MIKRTLEISNPAYLKVRQRQLVIEREQQEIAQVPFEDIGILLISHNQVVLSHSVIQNCAEAKAILVHCNTKYLPVSLTLPLCAHSLHTKVLREQVALKPVRRKQLWQKIVQAKVAEQALTLERLNKPSLSLQTMVKKVKSGDSTNIEAQAAQKYWKLLINKDFKRDPDLEGLNSLLNYGYAILRALIARAIVITGFHPALGLNHSNQYNPYCLADDLMEPFRPWIDECVMGLNDEQISLHNKRALLELLATDVNYQQKKQPLMVVMSLWAAQLKKAYTDKDAILDFPQRV